jgi:hypothetical protein
LVRIINTGIRDRISFELTGRKQGKRVDKIGENAGEKARMS